MRTESADLSLMQTGDRGRIASVAGDDPTSVRLLELGLLPGEDLEVIGVAPLGDPIAIRVRGTRLAIRRRDAVRVALSVAQTVESQRQVIAPATATT
ncbi:MAG: ferrous iron transport protein A [Planctomycetaceae bacterium]